MKKYELFTAKEIKPAGWMLRQLEIEANGQSGNLDKMWPDVRDSAWIGGTCEGWERVPYWLDGFIPLAYLLDSDDMKARAKKYVDAIIERQCEDGWICPAPRISALHTISGHFSFFPKLLPFITTAPAMRESPTLSTAQ